MEGIEIDGDQLLDDAESKVLELMRLAKATTEELEKAPHCDSVVLQDLVLRFVTLLLNIQTQLKSLGRLNLPHAYSTSLSIDYDSDRQSKVAAILAEVSAAFPLLTASSLHPTDMDVQA